jgi:hypothetical protein
MFLCGEEKANLRSSIPEVMSAGSPLAPAIQCLRNSQNVAGLWLKYGVKSLKIETSSQCKILVRDATIC